MRLSLIFYTIFFFFLNNCAQLESRDSLKVQRFPASTNWKDMAYTHLEQEGHKQFRRAYAYDWYNIAPYITSENRWIIFKTWVDSYRFLRGKSIIGDITLQNYFNQVRTKNQAINIGNMIRAYHERGFGDFSRGLDFIHSYEKIILETQTHNQDLFVQFLIKDASFSPSSYGEGKNDVFKITQAIQGEKSLEFAKRWSFSRQQVLIENLHLLEKVDEDENAEKAFLSAIEAFEDKQFVIDKQIVELALKAQDDPSQFKNALAEELHKYDGNYLEELMYPEDESLQSSRQKMVRKILKDFGDELEEYDRSTAYKVHKEVISGKGISLETKDRIIYSDDILLNLSLGKKVGGFIDESLGEVNTVLKDYFESPKTNIKPQHFQDFFLSLIDNYFKNLSREIQEEILRDFLELSPEAKLSEKFGIIIQNSGPQMQKLLQILAREEGLDESFANVLKELEDNVKAVPIEDIRDFLEKNFNALYPEKLRFLDEKAIGWGTLAGNFAVEVEVEGQWRKVALRVLRPGIEEKMNNEDKIFSRAIPNIESDPKLKGTLFENFGNILKKIQDNARQELNAGQTAENQFEAYRSYRALPEEAGSFAKGVSTRYAAPEILEGTDGKAGIILQEFVDGQHHEKFFAQYPHLKKQVAEDIAKLWTREAFFFSGFHHADLHLGNMLFRMGEDDKVEVFLLDYGMAKKIPNERRGFLLRAADALSKRNVNEALEFSKKSFFNGVTPPNDKHFIVIIEKAMAEGKVALDDFLEFLIEEEIELSDDMISLNRGMHLIDQLLKNSGSDQRVMNFAREGADEMLGKHKKMFFKPINVPGYGDLYLSPFRKNFFLNETKRIIGNSCKKLIRIFF